MENNAFHYNSLARTLMGYRKLPWNPGWLLPEEPKFARNLIAIHSSNRAEAVRYSPFKSAATFTGR